MKTLYIDAAMGAAGDMLTAALYELTEEPQKTLARLNALGIPGVTYEARKSVKKGIAGTHMAVLVNGEEEDAFFERLEAHHHHNHNHEHDHEHHHDHDHHHHHHHDHEHSHDYDHEHSHDHDHEHSHDHDHEHSHEHTHDEKHSHHHSSLHTIEHIIEDLQASENVKNRVLSVYRAIAEAESHVHGESVEHIHFHEVGSLDAVADVAAVCLLMEELSPERVVVSPIHTGFGEVKCAHGILSVPAPATAYLLRGMPSSAGGVEGELLTPTGAALLKEFATDFGNLPLMKIEKTGYGMGKKDFERANCVRVMLGEGGLSGKETESFAAEGHWSTDFRAMPAVPEISFNVDDMTAEEIGFACERLFEAGAFEVYTVPIGMKKGRPGTLIRAICPEENLSRVIEAIYRHTTTIGLRVIETHRFTQEREELKHETAEGPVREKISRGFGKENRKIEYEDAARLAKEKGISLRDARKCLAEEIYRS